MRFLAFNAPGFTRRVPQFDSLAGLSHAAMKRLTSGFNSSRSALIGRSSEPGLLFEFGVIALMEFVALRF